MKTIKTIIKTLIVLLLVITSISNDSFKVHAEPTDGNQYAILTDENDLVFFRSYDTYTNKQDVTVTDINGHSYTGRVYYVNSVSYYDTDSWYENRERIKHIYVAENTVINAPSSMSLWFMDCVNLETFDSTGFDTSKVDAINSLFDGCKSLKSVDLSSFNTSNVEHMDCLFRNCTEITNIDVSNFDTSNVKNMGAMFDNCQSLKSVDLSNFNTVNVTYIAEMFRDCCSLKEIDISNFNTSNVTNMHYMFEGCCSLKTLKIGPLVKTLEESAIPAGTWKNGNLQKTETQLMNAYAANADRWAGIWVRDIIPVEDVRIRFEKIVLEPGDVVSIDCVIYPENATINEVKWISSDESIASIDNEFESWASVKALKYGDVTITVESYDDSKASDSIVLHIMDSYAYAVLQDNGDLVFLRSENAYNSYEKTTITDINGAKYSGIVFADVENTSFERWAIDEFADNNLWLNPDYRNLIKRVYVAMGNIIYPSNMSGWFYRCNNLESFDGNRFDTYGLNYMTELFFACNNLKSVDLSSFDTSRVTSFYRMFRGCNSLTDLDLSNFNTKYAESMYEMFCGCLSLQKLDISGFSTKYVNEMDNMFSNCCSLREIVLGPDFKAWKDEAYLPEGTWKNGSLQRTEKQLYSDYPQNASSWSGTWSRDFVLATGLSLSNRKIQVRKNSGELISFSIKPNNATANRVKVECDNNLVFCHVDSNYNNIWIESNDKLGSCIVTVSTVDGSNISTTITVEVVDEISTEIDTELTRIYGSNRFNTSMAISDFLAEMKGGKHETVILANGDNFADALAGSYLAAVKNAPIIITRSGKEAEINKYIRSVLKSNGTLYVLGGTSAVPESCLSGLDGKGYEIKRLAGNNRYLTNLEILKEAGVNGDTLLIATGTNYADSLSASATGLPMLLVKDSLNDDQKAFLKEHKGMNLIILGGTNAVSGDVEKRLKSYGTVDRIAGANRAGTSIAIGHRFFDSTSAAVVAYSHDFPDGLCGGPLAYRLGAPLVLTREADANASGNYLQNLRVDDGYILGGTSRLTDTLVKNLYGVKSSTKINEIKK